MPKGLPGFSKVVISLWFRVPKSSLIACARAATSPQLDRIIPLVTFGTPLKEPDVVQKMETWDNWVEYDPFVTGVVNGLVPVISFTPVSAGDVDVDPSYLGVSVGQDGLRVGVEGNFQTTAMATTDGEFVISGCTLHYGDPSPGANPSYDGATTTWVEYATPTGPQAYYFELPDADADSFAGKWHHLLVSCDLSGSVSTNSSGATIAENVVSYNRMWVALDDVNVNGYDAFPNFVGGDDLNAVITDAARHVAGSPSPPQPLPSAELKPTVVTRTDGSKKFIFGIVPLQNEGTADAPATCNVPSVPVSAQPLGLPATADQVNHVFNVEMAELQIFIDVTLDTGVESNRRAFIDYERDDKGRPIMDKDGNKTLKPVDMSQAEKLLGKKPEVKLHGSSKWKAGKNTGTIGMDYSKDPPQEKPDGQFQPTGGINAYKPDPSITQEPPKP